MQSKRFFIFIYAAFLAFAPTFALADIPAAGSNTPKELTTAQRLSLAREFVQKISKKLKETDVASGMAEKNAADVSNLQDGEELLFSVRLGKTIVLPSSLLGVVDKGHINLSFRDFISAVDFPIVYDQKTKTADGWYIKEKKNFHLDVQKREVKTAEGTFRFSNAVKVDADDIYVPVDELATWFNFQFKPDISHLDLELVSATPLPIQEQMERKNHRFSNYDIGPAQLPRLADNYTPAEVPFVDVSTMSNYTHPGNGQKPQTQALASVRTAGDFAQGTLTTQSTFTKDDYLSNVRATYKRESLDTDLLGPLKAREYEIGDIIPVVVPLNDNATYGLGVHVTNADRDRTNMNASTNITGTTFPGWDVELYRGNQLLGYQTVGDDGIYSFENVDLFTEDNRFRVVLYGPQGEQQEQEVFVPVDPSRLAEMGSAYDISIVGQDTQTYRKQDFDDKDRGAPNITAVYEMPIANATAVSAGLTTRQNDGEMTETAHGGLSTKMLGTLFNLNTAVDNNGETSEEIIARRKFGEHEFRNRTRWSSDKFGVIDQDNTNFFGDPVERDNEVFNNDFELNGPLGLNIGEMPRYNLGLNYTEDADGRSTTDSTIGMDTYFRPLSLTQQFQYETSDVDEDKIDSLTSLSGTFGKNRVRLTTDYQVKPESRLDRVAANYRRLLTPNADLSLDLQHYADPSLTQVSAQLDWNTGFMNLSPGISYDTDHNVIATLNTRFGLARDPSNGSIHSYDNLITSFGGASAFVFLDKNGNNIFDEGDEPIEGAVVKAPQNGGREVTDKDGRALFKTMGRMRLTDVYVDPDSLPDPYWIPGTAGVSVLPREGHVVALNFPVHSSGEMDGTVYAKGNDDTQTPQRGLHLSLYDKTGTKIQSTTSENDGYYIFSKIPPGNYYLAIDDPSIGSDASRPLPQPVRIGYEGTTIYSNNIYLQLGKPDVPITILAKKDAVFGARADEFKDRNLILNLGSYKSQLMAGLIWFKLNTAHRGMFANADLITKPAELYPDSHAKYPLKASLQKNDLDTAYKICSVVVAGGDKCSVEILPGALEQEIASR